MKKAGSTGSTVKKSVTSKCTAAVIVAGALWGFMGFFTRRLMSYGIDSTGTIMIRCLFSALCFAVLILVTDVRQFKIKPGHAWCFVGTGIFSLLFFTFCYFNAINLMSLSAAAILLYIAPSVVTVLSALLFKEKITAQKVFAVILAFVGCCLVSGITGGVSMSVKGILFGIGSGVGYALYSIFARYALERHYTSTTINFYSCLLAGAGALIIWGPHGQFSKMFSSSGALFCSFGVAVLCCFLPYLFYTYGLTGLENGRASVFASVEPVVASLVGFIVYKENPGMTGLLGILLVLFAVVLLNIRFQKRKRSEKDFH